MAVDLYGYRYSVYSWIARLALHEKAVRYNWVEVDPFGDNVPVSYLAMHPFKRVPALVHGDFIVYETSAITRYIDEAFDGPNLQRTESQQRARCNQVMSIVDSYAYWPLVRQVFSHAFFRPRMRRTADVNEIRQGLDAAPTILTALEMIAANEQYLCGDELSLADIHVAPMIGYFVMTSRGESLFQKYNRLRNWWSVMSQRTAYLETMPRLPRASP
jgi:glutathione S-transferase